MAIRTPLKYASAGSLTCRGCWWWRNVVRDNTDIRGLREILSKGDRSQEKRGGSRRCPVCVRVCCKDVHHPVRQGKGQIEPGDTND